MLAEERQVRRAIWAAEREVERAVSTDGPLLVGPWTGEVGYEVLYWVPFLRWLCAAYRLPAERLVAVSRGGTASWYAGVASRYVDIFDVMPADEFGRRARELSANTRTSKQRDMSPIDREITAAVSQRLGGVLRPVHPSLMYRLFAPFWSGHASMSFLERHLRFARIQPPGLLEKAKLPAEYTAVKFYTARSLPASSDVRETLRAVVTRLAERSPVVLLEAPVRVDEHEDFAFSDIPNTISAARWMTPATNLGVQTDIIAGARTFIGTCGSIAWLAPLLGVNTVGVLADAGFLHAHLHVARRAFGRLDGAGAFSPCDVGAALPLGLTHGA